MPENAPLHVVPDPPDSIEPRHYFSVTSLGAALVRNERQKANDPDADLSTLIDQSYLLKDAIRESRAQGPDVAIEKWAGDFDLLKRYRDTDMARRTPPQVQPTRSSRRRDDQVNPDLVEIDTTQRERPRRPPPGEFTGRTGVEHLRQLDAERDAEEEEAREKAERRAERRAERQAAKEAAEAEITDSPDRVLSTGSGAIAATSGPDKPISDDPPEREDSPVPRKKRGWAVPDAIFIQVEARDVLKRRDLSAGAKLLYGFLENWSRSWDWKPVDATQTAIAEALGVSRHTIGRWAKELTDNGLIKYQRRYARNPGKYDVMPLPSEES